MLSQLLSRRYGVEHDLKENVPLILNTITI